ncbi:MAG: hypothetical protein Q4G07_06355 [Oscillospiraceae bacterium]|nr:hypothetical protein [Oscillospiraceae bacterium]
MKTKIKRIVTVSLATLMLLCSSVTVFAAEIQPRWDYLYCSHCKTLTPHENDCCRVCGTPLGQ